MDRPVYKSKPIGSIESLAQALRISSHALLNYADQRDHLYDFFQIEKRDGSAREICNPKKELKFVQKRINRAIFDNVEYPPYLYGGIKDRDYVKNATEHAGAKALIALDVRDFYPSISEAHVKDIFKNFCHFPDDVASILVRLTTLAGAVPQGACTSSNLANLVFYEVEHILVKDLRDQRICYTRLLDDVSISSKARPFGKKEQEKIIKRVSSMLSTRGMHLKNKKTKVVSKENPVDLMEVTGLWLNRGLPRVKRIERIEIRKELRKTERTFGISRTSEEYHSIFNKVSGRVAKIAHLKHAEAHVARSRLRGIFPHLGIDEQIHLSRRVRSLSLAKGDKRGTLEYIKRYYQTIYLVNVLKRSNRKTALKHEAVLKKCRPTRTHESIVYG